MTRVVMNQSKINPFINYLNHNHNYYDCQQFLNEFRNQEYQFSFLNTNISSLSKHFDELVVFLNNIQLQFTVISLTEIRNINLLNFKNILPNYEFIYECSSLYKTGGIGMFIKHSTNY